MTEGAYEAEARSFTKGTVSILHVSKKHLEKGDRVLILDDFLAHGEAGLALCDIVEQAGAQVVGLGAAIEKTYQGGAERLRARGITVKSLAAIAKIEDGKVTFGESV